jgi:hypothetical protein
MAATANLQHRQNSYRAQSSCVENALTCIEFPREHHITNCRISVKVGESLAGYSPQVPLDVGNKLRLKEVTQQLAHFVVFW